jgi:hypothetical protein
VTISVRLDGLTVSIGDPQQARVYSYDNAGRLWSAFAGGVNYRRGLHGRVIARQRSDGARQRRWLEAAETDQLMTQASETIQMLHVARRKGQLALSKPLPDFGQIVLGRAAGFDATRSRDDAAQYHRVYQPVGILPPDQYMAAVLQLTEGCSFNTCTFCNFYKERPFRIKSPEALRDHALAVRDFLGDGLSLRRSIFLGDANALVVPMRKLLPLLDVVDAVFGVSGPHERYAFLDGFSGDKKSPADYRVLAERGLKRITIGMESGNAELLDFLRKPGAPDDVLDAVRAMKAGGVAVGVIVLIGAGGERYAQAHVDDTAQLINSMPLDQGDILYFSELVVSADLPYAQAAAQIGLQPLTADGMKAQAAAIEAKLRFASTAGGPRISRYDIREFVY